MGALAGGDVGGGLSCSCPFPPPLYLAPSTLAPPFLLPFLCLNPFPLAHAVFLECLPNALLLYSGTQTTPRAAAHVHTRLTSDPGLPKPQAHSPSTPSTPLSAGGGTLQGWGCRGLEGIVEGTAGGGAGAPGGRCKAEGGRTGEDSLGTLQHGLSLGKRGGSSGLSSLLDHSELPQGSNKQDSSREGSRGEEEGLRLSGPREGGKGSLQGPRRASHKALTACCPAIDRP